MLIHVANLSIENQFWEVTMVCLKSSSQVEQRSNNFKPQSHAKAADNSSQQLLPAIFPTVILLNDNYINLGTHIYGLHFMKPGFIIYTLE